MGQLVEGEWTTGKLTGDDGAFKVHTLVPAPLFLDGDAGLE